MEEKKEVIKDDVEFSIVRRLFSQKFVSSALEQEYSLHTFRNYGKKNARFILLCGAYAFPCYCLLDYILFSYVSILPTIMMVVNWCHTIGALIWFSYRPRDCNYLVIGHLSLVWIASGCIAGRYLPLEQAFMVFSEIYHHVSNSLDIVNYTAISMVITRILSDYLAGLDYVWIWAMILILCFIWSWAISYAEDSISRKIFYISRMKDKEQAELLAKKHSRTMFDLIEVKNTGRLKLVKKDILTNEILDDLSGMDLESVSGSSEVDTESTYSMDSAADSPEAIRNDMDQWFHDSRGMLRWTATLWISVIAVVTLSNWLLIPEGNENLRYYMYMYHVGIWIPFCLNMGFISFTNLISSYDRYCKFLGVMMLFSVITSWFDAISISLVDTDGKLTWILIARLFLIFYVRHNYPFQPRLFRMTALVVDFLTLITMIFAVDYWASRNNFHEITFAVLIPLQAEIMNTRVMKNVRNFLIQRRRREILIAEMKKEDEEMHSLLQGRYYQDDESLGLDSKKMKKINDIDRWTPDYLGVDKTEDMVKIFFEMLKDMKLLEELGVDEPMLRSKVEMILNSYRENPYHNARHALSVCHTLKYLLTYGGAGIFFTELERLSLMLAAISHDMGHPGLNNVFQIKVQSPLVSKFGFASVLERYHSHACLKALGDLEFIPLIKDEEVSDMKDLISSTILGTDPATFASTLSVLNEQRPVLKMSQLQAGQTQPSREPSPRSQLRPNSPSSKSGFTSAKAVLAKLILICSDVGNVFYETPKSEMWLVSLLNEFYLQGDKERTLGIEISLFMDRTRNAPYTLCCGFIDSVVRNMVEALADILDIEDFVGQMENNRIVFGAKKLQERMR